MERARAVAISVGLGILGLLLLEAGSRLLGRFPVAGDPVLTLPAEKLDEREFDPDLFWRLRPGAHRGPVSINSQGLRGPEVPADKGGEFRVLSLGESTTFARALSYEECYSALLQEELGTVGGRPVRVLNAGVPAYTLFQGYQYLRLRAAPLQPDAVLLYFGYNDFLPVSFLASRSGEAHGLTDRELFAQRQSTLSRLRQALLVRSNLLRGLGVLARRWHPAPPPRADARRPRVPAEDRRWLLEQTLALCRQRGMALVVVVPWYREFEAHAPLLREFAARSGVVLVDLPARLQELPRPRAGYFLDPVHPGAAGHRLIARTIADELRARWR